jgi:hypothetical protein
MSAENRALTTIVDRVIEAHEDAEHIDPAAIAAEALAKLNENELRYAGDLYMRQLCPGCLPQEIWPRWR